MLRHHGVEHQGDVRDIARHRSIDVEGPETEIARSVGDPARAWAQPDHRAERGRIADRARHVGAGGEPRLAGCERGRRSARRTSAGQSRVPRIERRAEHAVDGVAAGAELRRIRFGDHDGAVCFQRLDHDVGTIRDPVCEHARPFGPPHAFDCGEVLDHDRQSMEITGIVLAPGTGIHDAACLRARAIETADGQRVDERIDRGNPCLGRRNQIERADLATAEHGRDLARRKPPKLGHGLMSFRLLRSTTIVVRAQSMPPAKPGGGDAHAAKLPLCRRGKLGLMRRAW